MTQKIVFLDGLKNFYFNILANNQLKLTSAIDNLNTGDTVLFIDIKDKEATNIFEVKSINNETSYELDLKLSFFPGYSIKDLSSIVGICPFEANVAYDLNDDDMELIYKYIIASLPQNNQKDQITIIENHKFNVECNLRDDLVQEIRFGAPGTGKSYSIKEVIRVSYPNYEEEDANPFVLRTTIHGEYSYFDFVGNIIPVSENGKVSYKFIEGIFTKALIRAMLNQKNDVYLIIEEMSRGDIASIFGDIFQILDRKIDRTSVYKIDNQVISDQLIKYGAKSSGDDKVYLPNNLHIIGTANTSDQNVNVLDTAFKRRFSFVYESVKPNYDKNTRKILNSVSFTLNDKEFEWNHFYLAVNEFIVSNLGLSEDKQLGQFFVKFGDGVDVIETVKNKVLHYLWEDVQLQSMNEEFTIFNEGFKAFSDLYGSFDKEAEADKIFSQEFLTTYNQQSVKMSIENYE